ncbi:MAG: methyltransferase [Rhodobacteraceae bacterium]|nr:methyltransferase [Paracoccaceae bacterium]
MNEPRFLLPFEQGLIDMPSENVLVMRPIDSFGLHIFPASTVLEQGFKPINKALMQSGFNVEPRVEAQFELALVHLTRSKVESLGNIARAARMTDGFVLVNGAKTDGIESVLKRLKKIVAVEAVISKSHGKVFWFKAVTLPDWEDAAAMAENPAGFLTAAGMFSSEKIDQGSARLLPYLDGLKGKGADLGAGWGWLSKQVLALPDVAKLELYEADFKALEAAKINAADPRAVFHWADVTALPKPEKPFDFVVSNPPFHQSRKAEPELGKAFIKTAASLIKPKGRFLMVANRQLPYEATMEQYFKRWTVLEQDGQFKVFEATHPRK